jgi:ABC-type bacteriocin/lantibiotic exporter with double-glycine peptidase domain
VQHSTFSQFKQNRDYNCAAGAVNFFVWANSGKELDIDVTTRRLGCHPDHGTDHNSIVGFLDFLYRYESHVEHGHCLQLRKLSLPLLVNWWSGDDGHYSVITEITLGGGEGSIRMFDPADGRIHEKDWNEFKKNWYSNRYGKNWGLYLRDYAPMKEIHSGE